MSEMNDYDGDGAQDLTMISLGTLLQDTTEHLEVYALPEGSLLATIVPDASILGVLEGGRFVGYLHFSGFSRHGYPVYYNDEQKITSVLDTSGHIIFEVEGFTPVDLLKVPHDEPGSLAHLLLLEDHDQRITIIGDTAIRLPTDGQGMNPDLLTAIDPAFELKFESRSHETLSYRPGEFRGSGLMDYNTDGFPDLVTLTQNDDGSSMLDILDGEDFGILKSYAIPEDLIEDFKNGAVTRFSDVDGNGQKEILAGDNLVIFSDGTFARIGDDLAMLDVRDMDRDGIPDIIGRDLRDSTIQVWSWMMSSTSIHDRTNDPNVLIANIFPNPSSGSVTLELRLQDEGKYTLQVADYLGRLYFSQDLGRLRPGDHQLPLYLDFLPAGSYLLFLEKQGKVTVRNVLVK